MVVLENPVPPIEDFQFLISQMTETLRSDSKKDPCKYLDLGGTKLEDVTVDILKYHARGTCFDGSIVKWSGGRFPDIVAKDYYGIEVKTSKSPNWTSTGSSVAEGTRVAGVERIFMLFGKLCDPIDFICKPYEECLSDVVVTHSPRYLINMRLEAGETIFDKMKIPYDEMRIDNPIQKVLEYYRKIQKGSQRPWWLGGEDERSNFFITDFSQINEDEKRRIRSESFCLFPELLGGSRNKYKRLMLYLVSKGYVSANLRDHFSAGGSVQLNFEGKEYSRVPKVVKRIADLMDLIPNVLMNELTEAELSYYWETSINSDRFSQWLDLIDIASKKYIGGFPLKNYLEWIYGQRGKGQR